MLLPSKLSRLLFRFVPWFYSSDGPNAANVENAHRIDWIRAIPFIGMHVGCLAVFAVGWSWLAIGVALGLYMLRVFALTAFYHRYFAHRAFKTWRLVRFAFAVIGCAAVQRGPLWWAAHHRHHHIHSDDEQDLHSPRQHGILWSHFGWFLTPHAFPVNLKLIPDFARYPELRFIDRFDLLAPAVLAISLFLFGALVEWLFPESGVTGFQLLVWGFFLSTVAVYHVTFLVNSATHLIGSRRYQTKDDSRNSLVLALLTFGEGWHNNHHRYPNATRQGFFWWEIDVSYYGLRFMAMLGLVWDLRPVPRRIMDEGRRATALSATPLPITGQLAPVAER
jgi:stearoyl-CoA desaturase (delta-9 desaturase)